MDHAIVGSKIFWLLLLFTVAGEFIIPWLLKKHYPGYDSKKMVMSVLGSKESPVRRLYNAWLIWLGCFLAFTAFIYFMQIKTVSYILAVVTLITILAFAVGAGIFAGLFSVNATGKMVTAASKIHGAGAAAGFIALLFFPLLSAIASFKQNSRLPGGIFIASFVFALAFFSLFVMADKEKFKNTPVANEGLWQRLTLLFMYAPFIYQAICRLLS